MASILEKLFVGIFIAALPSSAGAAVIAESASNSTMKTAQNIDFNFALDRNNNITSSTTIPHATVQGGASENEFDWYSFTVGQGGGTGIFDIDNGFTRSDNFDSQLFLYDALGTQIGFADDNFDPRTGATDPGSQRGFDAYLTYTFSTGGLYYLKVAECCTAARNGPYQLHVSLSNPVAAAVPEPATWATMLFGLAMVAGAARFRRRRYGVACA